MLTKYNLHARILSWSNKWIYIQGVFTMPGKKTVKRVADQTRTGFLSNNDNNPDSGTLERSERSVHERIKTTTESKEIICAVIYGRYVFKRKSRETVSVSEALTVCGYNLDEEMEKRRAKGWEYVKGLEFDWERIRALKSVEGII